MMRRKNNINLSTPLPLDNDDAYWAASSWPNTSGIRGPVLQYAGVAFLILAVFLLLNYTVMPLDGLGFGLTNPPAEAPAPPALSSQPKAVELNEMSASSSFMASVDTNADAAAAAATAVDDKQDTASEASSSSTSEGAASSEVDSDWGINADESAATDNLDAVDNEEPEAFSESDAFLQDEEEEPEPIEVNAGEWKPGFSDELHIEGEELWMQKGGGRASVWGLPPKDMRDGSDPLDPLIPLCGGGSPLEGDGHAEDPIAVRVVFDEERPGSYAIKVERRSDSDSEGTQSTWLQSTNHAFVYQQGKRVTAASQRLRLREVQQETIHGVKKRTFAWAVERKGGNAAVPFETTIYQVGESCLVFEQNFPEGLDNIAVGRSAARKDGVSAGFPVFDLPTDDDAERLLGFAALYGKFGSEGKYGNFTRLGAQEGHIPTGIQGGLPLILFDRSLEVSSVVSPLSRFTVANAALSKERTEYHLGVLGSADSIPAGFQFRSIAVFSARGIAHATRKWGRILQTLYQKTPVSDVSVSHLSYWTDNGAYYYYRTEPNQTYPETLESIALHFHKDLRLPIRSMQVDSWWYPQGAMYGQTRGVKVWAPRRDLFPRGLAPIHRKLKMPILAHSRFFAEDNLHARQNGGLYDFLIQNHMTMPMEARFWDSLFRNSTRWGLYMYEQDWMWSHTNGLPSMTSNVTLAEKWLDDMAKGAEKWGVRVQYCMPYSRHIMQSVKYDAVTSIRGSTDYRPTKQQWDIGLTAPIIHALGAAPFKDTFWTSMTPTDRYKGAIERYPGWQGLVSTLSMGPVGPGDRLSDVDFKSLFKCCRKDGKILKPSRALGYVDALYAERAFQGVRNRYAFQTLSQVGDLVFRIFTGFRLREPFDVGPLRDADDLRQSQQWLIWNPHEHKEWSLWTPESSLVLPKHNNYRLLYASPVWELKAGVPSTPLIALGGELHKWTPVSPQRFIDIRVMQRNPDGGDGQVTLLLEGVAGEVVELRYFESFDGGQTFTPMTKSITFREPPPLENEGGGEDQQEQQQDGSDASQPGGGASQPSSSEQGDEDEELVKTDVRRQMLADEPMERVVEKVRVLGGPPMVVVRKLVTLPDPSSMPVV
ncbi:unnamed protein product [Vitrella brassicaformis CCMP3155]|uniref:Uncharacterized protein n=2 Tax=Vitrella brassicaformis TaxID=1169539 RepID=A0A0G4F117_VITBC|nr:unnamed protein product [Vitrella brassicaformis CCMP3155]|eukprot:CEM05382.1 unnamed protein product [Vitrella brassicaformis CCMP3155]